MAVYCGQQTKRTTANNGRGSKIRTCDPLVPNQVRYQTAPCPDGPIDTGKLNRFQARKNRNIRRAQSTGSNRRKTALAVNTKSVSGMSTASPTQPRASTKAMRRVARTSQPVPCNQSPARAEPRNSVLSFMVTELRFKLRNTAVAAKPSASEHKNPP